MYNGIEPKKILEPSSVDIGNRLQPMKTNIINVRWLNSMFWDVAFKINANNNKAIMENEAIFASSKFEMCLNFADNLRQGLSIMLNEGIKAMQNKPFEITVAITERIRPKGKEGIVMPRIFFGNFDVRKKPYLFICQIFKFHETESTD